MEEFVIDFVGDTFSFSVALSDHGLDLLHEMARTHHAIAEDAKVASIGATFSGMQLLEMFLDQLRPNPQNPRKGIGVLGLSGPEGRAIAFYPRMPPGFDDTPEADNYNYKITIPGTQELDPEARFKELEKEIAAKPADPKPYGELAARYSRQGRLLDCIRCLQEAITHAAPSAGIHGLLGETFVVIGRNDEAAEQFQKAAGLEPDNASAQRGLAVCLMRLGEIERSLGHFEAAARLDPAEWRNHSNLGFALAACEKHIEAIVCYERAAEIAPNEVDNMLRLGWLFEIKERYEEALASFERAVRVAPDHAEAHYHAGRMMAKTGRLSEAIDLLERSIAIEETADRQLSLGDAFVKCGQWGGAEVAFRRAIELGTTSPDIRYGLAAVMANQQKVAEAESKDLLRAAPDHPLAEQLLAELRQRHPGD